MIRTSVLTLVLLKAAQGRTLDDAVGLVSGIPIPPPKDGASLWKISTLISVENLERMCPMEGSETDIRVDDIRGISDQYCAAGNPSSNSHGLTDMVWAFGQFLDHDIVGTLEDKESPAIEVPGVPGRVMRLHRAVTVGGARRPPSVHTAVIDGGAVYGQNRDYEADVIRMADECYLRESVKGFLPISTSPDSSGVYRWIAGDVRVDENAVLTTMHTVWLREHNRLCDELNRNPRTRRFSGWRKWLIAKRTSIAKMQQITLNEWLPALNIHKWELQSARGGLAPHNRLSVEFSVAFRMGHTMIPDKIGGVPVSSLFDGQAFFLNQGHGNVTLKENAEQEMSRLLGSLSTEPAAEMDARVSDSLRNVLFGPTFQEDLVSRNIFRGRDLNLASYATMARCFGVEPDMKVQSETPDAWVGLLREPRNGQPLGPTHRAMLIDQFSRIFYGDSSNWWETRYPRETHFFLNEIKEATMAKVLRANFDVDVPANVFKL